MIDRACISLNARCNLNCEYCHFGEKKNAFKRSENEFTKNQLMKLMENIISYVQNSEMDIFKLGIVGSGEPLLNFEDIVLIVQLIKINKVDNKIKLYTITNGTLLTDEILSFFYDNKEIIDLNFSLDGYKEIHELNRPGFEKTMLNINKYEKLFGYKPLINAVVTKATIENTNEVIDFFLTNRFTKVNFSILFGQEDSSDKISNSMFNQFIEECHKRGLIMRQKVNGKKKYDCTKYGNLCGVGRTNIFIAKSGIYPCSRFLGDSNYLLGDFNSDFSDIESELNQYQTPKDGECYYETHKAGSKL